LLPYQLHHADADDDDLRMRTRSVELDMIDFKTLYIDGGKQN
jgi:hypothetical protein